MAEGFGEEVERKMMTTRCPFSREDVEAILVRAVRDCIRQEIGEALEPIRTDIRDLQDWQEEQVKHCATETSTVKGHAAQLNKLWEKADNGSQCKSCGNQNRLTVLETTVAGLVKLGWIIATAVAGLAVKGIWDAIHHAAK